MPTSRLGKWAGRLLVASVVTLAAVLIGFNTDAFGEEFTPGHVGGLALWVPAAIVAVGTLVTGLVSRLRFKDRSVVVIVATIYGVLATLLFVMGSLPG
jgi:hypothetical protein